MGLQFEIMVRPVKETFDPRLSPEAVAESLSRLKANAFAEKELTDSTLIITADTVVALGNEILGKPNNRKEALAILTLLSGEKHRVVTGVSLRRKGTIHTFSATTQVFFKKLSLEEIVYYVDHFKPYDKAGAYGIQEWIGHVAIEKIVGSYFNVMGLPTHKLFEELTAFVK